MNDYMTALYQRFFQEPDSTELEEEIEQTRQEVRDCLDKLQRRSQPPQEDPEGRRTAPHPLPRSAAHLRHHSPSERCGCQDGVLYAGPL